MLSNLFLRYGIRRILYKDPQQSFKKLVTAERVKNGRTPDTTMIIIDSKSIKNTYLAEKKGYDGGKKVSGIKLHIGVDTLLNKVQFRLPHAMCVTTANITDRDGAIEMLEMYAPNLSNVSKALCDGGYTGEDFAFAVSFLINAEVEIAKRSELHKFAVIPKRWVVERTFSWLEHFRRLWKNCERLIHLSFQFTIFAFVALLLKRL